MKKLWILALAAITVVACHQKEETSVVSVAGKITVEPIITKATEVNFETGDKIGLTVVAEGSAENYATNEALVYASDVFTSDLEWYADVYTKADLYAYYPYNETGAPESYFQFEDQSEGIGAADFMMAAKKGVLPTSNADVMLDSTFESFEALKNYAVHDAHVDVANTKVRPFTASRMCLDFEI